MQGTPEKSHTYTHTHKHKCFRMHATTTKMVPRLDGGVFLPFTLEGSKANNSDGQRGRGGAGFHIIVSAVKRGGEGAGGAENLVHASEPMPTNTDR